ncbi:hypothetical protein MMIN_04900 [Mycolicibacter minnesotensis]|nr:hypothetical protein MMIN_04900 [Mycolicibacter minnesotensis]
MTTVAAVAFRPASSTVSAVAAVATESEYVTARWAGGRGTTVTAVASGTGCAVAAVATDAAITAATQDLARRTQISTTDIPVTGRGCTRTAVSPTTAGPGAAGAASATRTARTGNIGGATSGTSGATCSSGAAVALATDTASPTGSAHGQHGVGGGTGAAYTTRAAGATVSRL